MHRLNSVVMYFKKLMLPVFIILTLSSQGQKIVYHDKDPFMHTETINTDFNILKEDNNFTALSFEASYETNNKTTDTLFLTFSMPEKNDLKAISDTSSGLCQVILADKQVCSGLYTRQLNYTSGGIHRHSITYAFNKLAYTRLIAQNATDVKLALKSKNFGSFHIDTDKQDKIANAIRLIFGNLK